MSNKNIKNSNRKEQKKEKLKVSSIDLHEKRIIYLDGDIDDEVAHETVELLLKMDMVNNKDITMYINSPGGSISAGFCIYDAMNLIKSDVRTICIGRAASMGCILLINGAKGKRYCTKHSEVMLHEVSGGAFGTVSEVSNHLEHSKDLNKKLRKIIVSKTKFSWNELKKDTTHKDHWYTADECLSKGIVDKILT
ncbi:MAG: ClpP family protease [Candidatus Coprovivens sp.]